MASNFLSIFLQQAKQMVEKNSSNKVSPDVVKKIEEEASQNWDKFYGIHQVWGINRLKYYLNFV